MSTLRYILFTLFVSAFLTACGSSSDSSTPQDDDVNETPSNDEDDQTGDDDTSGDDDDAIAATLSAHYRFENNLEDETGRFDGELTGNAPDTEGGAVTYSAGAVEGSTAVALDGTTGVALGEGLIGPGDYSISIWLHPDELTQFSPALFGQSGPNSWVSLVTVGPDPQDTMLWAGDADGTGWFDGTIGSQIPSGGWSHLVFTYSEGALTTYLNGELTEEHTDFPNVFSVDNAVFHLGVNPFGNEPYTGLVDELRIYSDVLTQEEVTALAAGGDYATDDGNTNGDDDQTGDDGTTGGDDQTGDDGTTGGDDQTGDDDTSSDDGATISDITGLNAHYAFSGDLSDSTGTYTTDADTTAASPWDTGQGSVTYDGNGIGGGQALALDGTSGVRLPDGLISSSTFTISLWVNPSELTNWTSAFFGEREEGRWFSIIPKWEPSDELSVRAHFAGNDPEYWDVTSNIPEPMGLSTNQWTHLAVTQNGSQLRLYIDGVLSGSSDDFDPTFEGSESGIFALGVNPFPDDPFKGLMDQLRIYDRALEADEVVTLSAENQ